MRGMRVNRVFCGKKGHCGGTLLRRVPKTETLRSLFSLIFFPSYPEHISQPSGSSSEQLISA